MKEFLGKCKRSVVTFEFKISMPASYFLRYFTTTDTVCGKYVTSLSRDQRYYINIFFSNWELFIQEPKRA